MARFADEEDEALVAIAKQQERSQHDIMSEALHSHPDIQAYLKTAYLKTKTAEESPQKPA